jgi:hypothetical protein
VYARFILRNRVAGVLVLDQRFKTPLVKIDPDSEIGTKIQFDDDRPRNIDVMKIDPRNNRRILVIDDNPAIHEDIRKILISSDLPNLEDDEAALFGNRT